MPIPLLWHSLKYVSSSSSASVLVIVLVLVLALLPHVVKLLTALADEAEVPPAGSNCWKLMISEDNVVDFLFSH